MKPISPLAAAALCLGLGSPLAAQQIVPFADAPFTATLSLTDNAGRTYPSEEYARASNGSTYVALKAKDGHTVRITIDDVPNNRQIELMPQPPSYTYRLSPAPKCRCAAYSVDSYRETLQRAQQGFIDRPDRDKPGGSHHHDVILGVRQQDGMTLFGHRDEITSQTGVKHVIEIWQSDLGLTYSNRRSGPDPGDIRISTITDLKRVEPDPKLFEIPAEYFPEHDPLMSAKTVFIENETGDPEVKDVAENHFNSWKHMPVPPQLAQEAASQAWRRITVVASKEKADIIAVFTNFERNDSDVATIVPAIEMKIYTPNSEEPIFTHHPAFNPNVQIQGDPFPLQPRYSRRLRNRTPEPFSQHPHRPDNPRASSRPAPTRPSPPDRVTRTP